MSGNQRSVVRGAMYTAYLAFNELEQTGATREYQTAGEDDFATAADKELTTEFERYFEGLDDTYTVLSEEGDTDTVSEDAEYAVIIDEFDGTANLMHGRGELPFGPVVAVADESNPTFEDVVAAAYLELTSGNLYEAAREEGAYLTPNWTGAEHTETEPVRTTGRETFEDGEDHAIVLDDQYMLGDTADDVVDEAVDRVYLGDYRSWAQHMAMVARGGADAAITGDHNALNPEKRSTAEEIAAGYRLVTEAGGAVTDWNGRDIGEERIGFHEGKTFDVVVAASDTFADTIADQFLPGDT